MAIKRKFRRVAAAAGMTIAPCLPSAADSFDDAVAAYDTGDVRQAAAIFLEIAHDTTHPKFGKSLLNLGTMHYNGDWFEQDLIRASMFFSLAEDFMRTGADRADADHRFHLVEDKLQLHEIWLANWHIRAFGISLDNVIEVGRTQLPDGFWSWTEDPEDWDHTRIVGYGNVAYWSGLDGRRLEACGRSDLARAMKTSLDTLPDIFPPALKDPSDFIRRYLDDRWQEGRDDFAPDHPRNIPCDGISDFLDSAAVAARFNLPDFAPTYRNVGRLRELSGPAGSDDRNWGFIPFE